MIVGTPFKAQLADQCNSFDKPVAKFPHGFFVEVKYDGERVMAHLMKDRTVKFFSRNGKDVERATSHHHHTTHHTTTPLTTPPHHSPHHTTHPSCYTSQART